jgi:hypothetical protein
MGWENFQEKPSEFHYMVASLIEHAEFQGTRYHIVARHYRKIFLDLHLT